MYEISLVVQELKIHLAMQGTQVRSWAQEDSTRTEQLSPCPTTTEAHAPGAHALQQEKPQK